MDHQNQGPDYVPAGYPAQELQVKDWFIYELDFADLAPGDVQTQSFTIETDSNFLWQQGVYAANIGFAAYEIGTQPIPNIAVAIQDTGSGRNLTSSSVPVQNFFGLGREPFYLLLQRWFRSNSTVKVTVNNYDSTDTYNLNLSFIGTKYFYYPG
jgi:hypothetical protein